MLYPNELEQSLKVELDFEREDPTRETIEGKVIGEMFIFIAKIAPKSHILKAHKALTIA